MRRNRKWYGGASEGRSRHHKGLIVGWVHASPAPRTQLWVKRNSRVLLGNKVKMRVRSVAIDAVCPAV